MSSTSQYTQPGINLPKGGGAIKGIGETFTPNLFSGTGNYTIPIAISPGRSGFGPSLSLQYSSGNGNGPFGLGWQLSIPRITRKTEKGLPQYDETDVFVMSGAEDLVPCLKKVVDPNTNQETWVPDDPIPHPFHTAYRYRPRTEGLFARIERWENKTTSEVHWRAITKDNITSIYGATSSARIANPDDERQVYEWLLQETFDATGNRILYEYARDNSLLYADGDPPLSLDKIFERNRRPTQLYLRRIYYGNLPDPLVDEHGQSVTYANGTEVGHLRGGRRYAFEVVFDYGDWDSPTETPHPDPLSEGEQELFGLDPSTSSDNNPVPIRDDCFSSFRARFEVRTLRRCRRVLMFHHFAELGGPTLVRSTDFEYHSDPDTLISFLASVTVTGYQKNTAGNYESAHIPPVTFKYSDFKPGEQRYQSVSAIGNDMPPLALDDPNLALVDLVGDGLPDVIQSTVGGFRYWRNLGSGVLDRPRSMPQVPAGISLSDPGVGFGDMGGDGQMDLLVHSGPLPGFFETTWNGTWRMFKPYDVVPSFHPGDPNVRLIDLTGNGLSDALLTEGDSFLWFECLGEKGFAPPKRFSRRHDLDQFPDVFFDDPAGRVRLADMKGDGLNDIVLIHNGRIDYWPNLGYGKFGARITMANAPHLEDNFDPKRLFLADLNGTGCADLVYVAFDRVHLWFNQSGNSWSETYTVTGTPLVTDVDSLRFADVFGTGTATLVWSYDYSSQPESNYKALDFCGGVKPYVLTEMSNNLGATTRVSYAPSTKYFLEDQENHTPWVTRLPFPVQVVDKVEVIDHISKTKLTTTYKYHHGYFDGREREFRGFGRVDQFDTETFEDFSGPGLHGGADFFKNADAAYYLPPVETRSWFHTGIYFDEDSSADDPFDYQDLADRFRAEFYSADEAALPLDAHDVETGETPHEAYRALRGAVLRTEVYARDESPKAGHPYTVTESRYRIQQLQPKDGNHHGVFFSHQLQARSYHYERNPADPRISESLTLEVDPLGNVLRSVAIGYGRRQPDPSLPTPVDQAKQTQTLITYTENSYTNAIDDPLHDPDNYRTPLPSESRSYELTGFKPAGNATRFSFDEWTKDGYARLNQAVEIRYEETADSSQEQKRLIEHVRTRYRPDDLGAAQDDPLTLLPLGTVESLALPGESYKLAFTKDLAKQTFVDSGKLSAADLDRVLADEGKYVHSEGDTNWWIPSGRVFYSTGSNDSAAKEMSQARTHFFLPHRYRDPFHTDQFNTETVVTFDAYRLLLEETRDALGNSVRAANDYRVLSPSLITDPNGNRSAAAFDALGMVVGTAVMGKPLPAPAEGDSFDDFEANLLDTAILEHLDHPLVDPHAILGSATTRLVYDLFAYDRTKDLADPQPAVVYSLIRETHTADLHGGETKVQHSFSYSDGFGREIQKKIQAEPGPVPLRDAGGKIIVGPDGQAVMTQDDAPTRWVGNGWTIFNNKGKPVRQYEPFFTDRHHFEFDVRIGVSPTIFYDPVDRMVATLHPNHSWEKVVFDPWRQTSYDVNDTVLNADGTTDPKSDEDVKSFFSRLPELDYRPTWYEERIALPATDPEWVTADKTAIHRQTPSVAHVDTLGRTFITIAHNRFVREGAIAEEKYPTRVELDIEGNQREVRDAIVQNGDLRGRLVMRYDYGMLGNQIHQASMEAGERWVLNDVTGKPIRAWDSRGHTFRTEYDELRRATGSFVTGADAQDPDKEIRFEVSVYGEKVEHAPLSLNLRGKVLLHCDGAGAVISGGTIPGSSPELDEAYDYKGNALRTTRRLAREYKKRVDWNDANWGAVEAALSAQQVKLEGLLQALSPMLDAEPFVSATTYDALNRPVTATTPDDSVYRATFNDANLLEKVDVNLRGDAAATPFVTNIDYNAKGQRELIVYQNGAQTSYEYDPLTFRLIELRTTRPDGLNGVGSLVFNNLAVVQDLRYHYDPAGNITRIEDRALKTVDHGGPVPPICEYRHDAVYRLVEAKGREHIGQTGLATDALHPPNCDRRDFHFVGLQAHPNDLQALRNYTESYEYDQVGNFKSLHHGANGGTWTRTYRYEHDSLFNDGNKSNRLTKTELGNGISYTETYTYADSTGRDVHGCMTSINDMRMSWDFRDQLHQVDLGGCGIAYYVYDAAGQRTRKVIEENGAPQKERIYLGGYEIYREFNGNGSNIKLERETLHVMDDKQRIALVETKTIENGATINSPAPLQRYQLNNHLGSANVELNHVAQLISYEEFHPYGTTSFQTWRSTAEVSFKRYRYIGMERDDETGFAYHGARYYAPWVGRWVSADPELPRFVSWSPFVYSFANPINYTDQNGRAPKGWADVIAGLDKLERGIKKYVSDTSDTIKNLKEMEQKGDVLLRNQLSRADHFARPLDRITHELEAIENATEPAERSQVRNALARARKLGGDLGEARRQIGLELKPLPKVIDLPANPEPHPDPNFPTARIHKEGKTTRSFGSRGGSEGSGGGPKFLKEGGHLGKGGRSGEGGPGGIGGALVTTGAVIDIGTDLERGDYRSAGIKTGALVIGAKFPIVGSAFVGIAFVLKAREVREMSVSLGLIAERESGSRTLGAVVAVTSNVAMAAASTAWDYLVPSPVRGAVEDAARYNSPGSLVPAGFITPTVLGPKLSDRHCFAGAPCSYK